MPHWSGAPARVRCAPSRGPRPCTRSWSAGLAAFKRTEASLTFQSGYAVNVGVIGSMLDEGDCVVSDKLNHASIIDGIRLTKADRILYEHADPDDAERALSEARGKGYRRILLVTDGVFSMDGDIAPLPRAGGTRGALRRRGDGRRRARHRRARHQRPRHHRPLRPARPGRAQHRHAQQGGRRRRWLRGRFAGRARSPHPQGAAVPVLVLAPTGCGGRVHRRRRRARAGAAAHRAALEQHASLQERASRARLRYRRRARRRSPR